VKIFQGIGSTPDTIKNWAFTYLVLFYFERVLGVPATLCGLALFIALCFDAVTDPIVGSISDNWRSARLGRRHPFMYAAAIPLAVCFVCLFNPPEDLGQTGLFLWLVLFAVLIRGFMTLFVIPWTALQAELSQDYVERTTIVSYRFLIGWTVGVTTGVLSYTFIFHATPEFTNGLFNRAGYPQFALWAAAAICVGAVLSTHLTRREIPFLPTPPKERMPFSLQNVIREVKLAFTNRPFRLVFFSILCSAAILGIQGALELYVNTYFWGLLPEQLRWFGPFMWIGAVAAFVFVQPVSRRFDKKAIVISVSAMLILDGMILISLRLMDLLPPNGEPLLLYLLIANAVFRTAIGVVSAIVGASMVADILDQQELETSERQEGVFFSALAFSGKAISGLGILVSGLVLDLLAIPRTAALEDVDPGIILRLGVFVGLVLPTFYLLPLWIISKYPLTRRRHAEIRAALNARHDDLAVRERRAS
jgi:Na+/melibiose symporter-like transporter